MRALFLLALYTSDRQLLYVSIRGESTVLFCNSANLYIDTLSSQTGTCYVHRRDVMRVALL